jgi:hypothetical protein
LQLLTWLACENKAWYAPAEGFWSFQSCDGTRY